MSGWDLFWLAVTQLGEATFYVLALAVTYLAHDRKLGKKLAATVLFNIWLNEVMKNAFKMPRPPEELWKVHVEGYGFPSGHAQGSTVFWGFLAAYYWSPYLGLSAAVLVALVSYSRIELRVHYPIDVVGGVIVGIAVLCAATVLDVKVAPRLGKRGSWLLVALPVVLFAFSTASGLGGKNAALTMGTLLGMMAVLAAFEEKVRAKPSMAERILCLAVGLPAAFAGYYSAAHFDNMYYKFAIMAVTGAALALIPILVGLILVRFKASRVAVKHSEVKARV